MKTAKVMYSYPTVVIEIKDHQNPSQEPLMNERGNSSLFQYVSYQIIITIEEKTGI